MKDLKEHSAFSILHCYLNDLQGYRFGGMKLEHSPARFVKQIINGFLTITKLSEPNLREILHFLHLYADYNIKFVTEILKECTHPWSQLAERIIDPVTLIECITGSNSGTEIHFDDDALSRILSSEKPWKTLFQLVLMEDRRLGEVL